MLYLNNMLEYINGTYHVQHVYDMGPSFRGYAASMNEQWELFQSCIHIMYALSATRTHNYRMLQSVRGMQEVEYVERNQVWHMWVIDYFCVF